MGATVASFTAAGGGLGGVTFAAGGAGVAIRRTVVLTGAGLTAAGLTGTGLGAAGLTGTGLTGTGLGAAGFTSSM